MNALSDIDKNMILDYLSELLDKEKNVLKKEQVVEISEESRKIQSSRSTKKLFSFFEHIRIGAGGKGIVCQKLC